jgi:hypothetical protein
LEANSHAPRLPGAPLLDPANFTDDLDGLGLGWHAEPYLQSGLQRKRVFGLNEKAPEGDVPRGTGTFHLPGDDLDFQPTCITGICSTKVV